MSDEHVVTAWEPYWQESRYVHDCAGHVTATKIQPSADPVDVAMDHAEYECSCGEAFETWSEAEEHLHEAGA